MTFTPDGGGTFEGLSEWVYFQSVVKLICGNSFLFIRVNIAAAAVAFGTFYRRLIRRQTSSDNVMVSMQRM